MRNVNVLCAALLLVAPLQVAAQATSCLVTGERSARVMTPEGERSPVFMAPDCEALRLVSGKAAASWVARDGKPRLMPITAQGPSGVPAAGAEERTVRTLWAELTSRRERQAPAFMRDIGNERPARVYLEEGGLTLGPAAPGAGMLRMAVFNGADAGEVSTATVASGSEARLIRENFQPDTTYKLELQRGDQVTKWRIRPLSQPDALRLESQLAELPAELDVEQRLMLQAMVFEHWRLPLNRAAAVSALRKLRGE